MRLYVLPFIAVILLNSCQEEKNVCAECAECGLNLNVKEQSLDEAVVKSKTSDGTLSDSTELKESIAKIEKKYGEQWDFCHCVVVNDSIDKAIKGGNSDDKLMARWDIVDKKCQAFRIQDPARTPEEREAHEKRVRKCLKAAGIR
jgi:hypothetical protein